MNSRGNITFIFDDTYTKNLTTKYLLTKHNGELTLYCYVKKGEFYQDLMGNTFRIVKDIEKQYAAGLTLPENQDLLAWTQENSAEILNFKTVKMDSYPFKNTYRFLFNSQEDIKDKKIILTRNFDISLDELKEIYLLKGLNLDMTIQTNINGDTVNYPLNTYIDVIKTSYNIMNEQLLFDNPFEKVLAIYDAIRNTNIPIDKNFLFQEILYSLYIPNCPFLIKKDENELVRTVAYLNDPKYRIDGFYSFDVAFEDKRNFNYFAKTAKEITALNKIDEVSNESV